MRREGGDAALLWDILDAARAIMAFTDGLTFAAYEQDRMRQLAVERCVEIIGEAARRVSGTFQEDHAEIPWRLIIAQRNVIAHEYGDIKQERLWALAVREIPTLIGRLENLIPSPPEDKA